MTPGAVPTQLRLPVRVNYEGRGAVLEDAAGNEIHFIDRLDALAIYALLDELHRLRTNPPECKEPHCDEGNCHQRGECPPPEPY